MADLICKFCGKECKNRNSLAQHEIRCKENPNKIVVINNFKNYNNLGHKGTNQYIKAQELGLPKPIVSNETRQKLSKSTTKINLARPDSINKKISETMKRRYIENPWHTYSRSKHGYYKGIWCDSTWELAYVIYNIDHNINFIRNTKHFSYQWKDKQHWYTPDFYLPEINTYVEIKGYYSEKAKAKTEQFPEKLIVLQEKDLADILDYAKSNYTDDLQQLFDK